MAWPHAESDVWGELILRLRTERQRQGVSILELEERLGVCRNYIEKLECGLRRPSGFMLACWCWVLGLRLQIGPLEEADAARGPPVSALQRTRRRLPQTRPLAY